MTPTSFFRNFMRLLAVVGLTGSWSIYADDEFFAIAIHGGAGAISKAEMTPEKEKAYRETLAEAIAIGYAILEKGGGGLDAVEMTIRRLEDSPLFNAGKGAVFTNEGANELDASIMEGAHLGAGAVAGVKRVKNPISLARRVMEQSPHVMMAGPGAEAFAQSQGLDIVDAAYFHTEQRWQALQKALEKEKKEQPPAPDSKHGTVGVVVLDKAGNLAAGTSTGGMTNKRFGRVGDSPIIGAGTYADNNSCAVSATGHGEYFIRAAVAHDIAARVAYTGASVQEAADQVIQKKLVHMGGAGGVIVIDRRGNIAMSFNTPGMYRGWQRKGEPRETRIYKE